jgi:hypothetical protein
MIGGFVSQALSTPQQQMRPFEDAYQEFLRSLHTLIISPQLQQLVAAAYEQYAQIAQSGAAGSAEMQRLASEAYARYLETLQRTISSGNTHEAAAEAFRRYVRAVKVAWTVLDPDAIPSSVLTAIGQTLTAAGWIATGINPHVPVTATPVTS